MAKITVTCPWCEEESEKKKGDTLKLFCWSCGHRADVPKVECDCRRCLVKHAGEGKPLEKVA